MFKPKPEDGLRGLKRLGALGKILGSKLRLSVYDNGMETQSNNQEYRGMSTRTINPDAYIISKKRAHEIETQKAYALMASRHEKWTAGGPI